jgi:GTP-binding protein HflX
MPTTNATRAAGAPGNDRAALVGLLTPPTSRDEADASLEELAGLCEAAGVEVALRVAQERPRPDAATFIGAGKVETVRRACDELDLDLVVFDNELTPAQLRNLERALDRRVLDRTQLILDIFARRARTREGKLQVELAQLKYLLPRLVGAGLAMSRLGGGIGTRGPGETKLETDRRRIRQRISALTRELALVRQRRGQLRERRRETETPAVALVGYTNAGKTTLFNRLSREQAVVSDALFVTLDPLVRQVRLPDGATLLLSDTVGFIDRLPHTLVAAFRATLEEVVEADLLLHVVDAANIDAERHVAAVHRVLEEVEARDVPSILVFNKIDCLDEGAVERLGQVHPDAALVSARTGEGSDALLAELGRRLGLDTRVFTLEFTEGREEDTRQIARLYRHGRVIRHDQADGRVTLDVEMPRRVAERLVHASASRAS